MTVARIKMTTTWLAKPRIRRFRPGSRGFSSSVSTSVGGLSDNTRVGLGDHFVYGVDLGNELSEHIG